jgi:hypothetical protein
VQHHHHATFAALATMSLLLIMGCPGGEQPALVSVPIEVGPAQGDSFSTVLGYDVVLDTGVIVLGQLHFHEPKDVEETALLAPWLQPLRLVLGPASACAHPGHDMSGDVMGEWAGTTFIDLLAPAKSAGEGSFYEGPYETASLLLQIDGVDADAGLDDSSPAAGHTLALSGTADRGDGPIPFCFVVDHDETILGLDFDVTVATDAIPAVTLLVDPAEILAHLEFADVDTDGDGTVTMNDADAVNPLLFGLESNLSYHYEIN